MNVLVYSGRGVSAEALHHAVYSLRASVGAFYDVKLVTAASLAREPWEEGCSLLVMPGGRDVPYEEELAGRACDRIRRWIASGAGRYLGLCAGAYWACAAVSFEPETPLAVVGSRELALCQATARGTIFPDFEYGSDRGAHAARIALNSEQMEGDRPPIPIYYNGGCWFDFASGGWQSGDLAYALIGSYVERDHRPAIVAGQLPGGQHWSVLLSGVHVEYAADEVARQRPEAGPWMGILKEGEHARLALWNQLLGRLGLQVRPSLAPGREIPHPTPLYVGSADGDLGWLLGRFAKGQWPCEVTTFRLHTQPGGEADTCAVSDESYPLIACAGLSALRPLPWTFSLEKYFALWREANGQRRPLTVGGTLLYAEYINSTQTILSQYMSDESPPPPALSSLVETTSWPRPCPMARSSLAEISWRARAGEETRGYPVRAVCSLPLSCAMGMPPRFP